MMRYPWFDEYCMAKPGVTKDHKAEWSWNRYMVGGKLFAAVMVNGEGGVTGISLKCEPEFGDHLRNTFDGITAGYYMNKVHWNTVWMDREEVPDKIVREMADRSYRLIFSALPKKTQAAILAE